MARKDAVSRISVQKVNLVADGVVITFQDQKSAFFEAEFLYRYQDVNGNYPFDEDVFTG